MGTCAQERHIAEKYTQEELEAAGKILRYMCKELELPAQSVWYFIENAKMYKEIIEHETQEN